MAGIKSWILVLLRPRPKSRTISTAQLQFTRLHNCALARLVDNGEIERKWRNFLSLNEGADRAAKKMELANYLEEG